MTQLQTEAEETFEARGHPNVRSTHGTTLMVTREEELTLRGDCIVAVCAEKSLKGMAPELKKLIQDSRTRVTLSIEAEGSSFEVTGWGDPKLPLNDPLDMVARKSAYVCGRTLMIKADKAACDIPKSFVELLQEADQRLRLTIKAKLVTQNNAVKKKN